MIDLKNLYKKVPWLFALYSAFLGIKLLVMGYSGEFIICKEFTGISYYIAITIPGLLFILAGIVVVKFCKI